MHSFHSVMTLLVSLETLFVLSIPPSIPLYFSSHSVRQEVGGAMLLGRDFGRKLSGRERMGAIWVAASTMDCGLSQTTCDHAVTQPSNGGSQRVSLGVAEAWEVAVIWELS